MVLSRASHPQFAGPRIDDPAALMLNIGLSRGPLPARPPSVDACGATLGKESP